MLERLLLEEIAARDPPAANQARLLRLLGRNLWRIMTNQPQPDLYADIPAVGLLKGFRPFRTNSKWTWWCRMWSAVYLDSVSSCWWNLARRRRWWDA